MKNSHRSFGKIVYDMLGLPDNVLAAVNNPLLFYRINFKRTIKGAFGDSSPFHTHFPKVQEFNQKLSTASTIRLCDSHACS